MQQMTTIVVTVGAMESLKAIQEAVLARLAIKQVVVILTPLL